MDERTVTADTLIVEGNSAFRAVLEEILRSWFPAMSLRATGSADEALRMVAERPPDLVIMDIHTRGRNGLEVMRRIKAMRRDVVVLVLTQHDLPEYRAAVAAAGGDHFLVKGDASLDELLLVVERVGVPRRTS